MVSEFDEEAATWDDDGKVERARAVAAAIRDAIPVAADTRLLEYGAGTGLLSEALADDVAAITLAEPSSGMREIAQAKIERGSLPPGTRVWNLDLASDEAPDDRFDLIATMMALHHIRELAPVLAGFAELLAPDGRLCVVDLEEEDGAFHATRPGFDGHDGFSREGLTDLLETAGFDGIEFRPCHEVEKDGRMYPLFLATAARSAS